MKNLKYILPIIFLMFCIILFVVCIETTCSLDNCDNTRISGGKYCSEHNCEWEGCTSQKGAGKKHYCYYHVEQNALNNQVEEVVLTDSQVQKAKEAVREYTKKLMDKQTNILAINLINDYPEYVSEYSCSFRCNVVREDDNTNLATIYLSIDNDGNFKVSRLMYDE